MQFEVQPSHVGTRLDLFLSEQFTGTSRSLIQEWITDGHVQVNQTVQLRGSRKLREGDFIDVEPAYRKPLKAKPENIALEILYEDDHLAVINKPAGMSVHQGAGHHSGTLVNALLHHLNCLSTVSGELRPGIVHRLDRFTSGVLLVAKHDISHRRLQEQFQNREVQKHYWAVVEGVLPIDPLNNPKLLIHGRPVKSEGHWWLRLEMPIRRDKRNRVKMAISHKGREAISDVRCLQAGEHYTLAEIRIHTGRTHQIRVHLSSIGHPVVGDTLYGARRAVIEATVPERCLLHAQRLAFKHPDNAKPMSFESPLPPDFKKMLQPLGL